MAKLHARNRTELLRMEKYTDVRPEDLDRVVWQRHTIVFMSDGIMLTKYDVKNKPGPYDAVGRLHSLGWKKKGQYTLSIEENKKRFSESGWSEVVK